MGHEQGGTRYTLFECAACSLQHWQPLVHPSAGYYEGEGEAMYAALHDGTRAAAKDPRFVRILRDFGTGPRRRVLDIGCGDGALLSLFKARGDEVMGLDIDQRSLSVARSRGIEVSSSSLEEVAATEDLGKFDLVCMSDVLEHLTNPVDALRSARRLCGLGGQLVGTVPNRRRLLANLVLSDFPPHHFLRFDEKSLGCCLDRAGFDLRHVEVFEFGYALPSLVNSTLRHLSRARRRAPLPSPAPASPPSAAARDRRVPQPVADLINEGLARASVPFERALSRGFKLYFIARPKLA